jgi:SAM-dependent methyltransferase
MNAGQRSANRSRTGAVLKTIYHRHAESGLWERSNGRLIPYSDGNESRILNIVRNAGDLGVLSCELASSISDWPTEYHFSRSRHCLLRPLGIQPGDRVLELGCGCGALTRYLGECGAQVTAVEGSRARAEAAAARCRDLPNVAVHLDNLTRFASDDLFDWVLLIGVLEYAPVYSEAPDPVHEYLVQSTRFLASGGRLVLAIENKLGLKYFNGCSEDHVGRPYYGIQGLYKGKQPITFGRKELSGHLANAGLAATRFYYPFPDYKLPSAILTDAALSATGFDACALLPLAASRDYASPTAGSFSEPLVQKQLLANGLLADFANAFLVTAARTPPASSPDNSILAWQFEVDCHPSQSTQTTYLQTDDGIVADQQKLVHATPGFPIPVNSFEIPQDTRAALLSRTPDPVGDAASVLDNHGAKGPCVFEVDEQVLAGQVAAIPGPGLGRVCHLVRKPFNDQRDDRAVRIHFEWRDDEGVLYQLVAGPDADADFARTEAFHHAYPDLGIRPVALMPTDGGSVAVFEHFEGFSLEKAMSSGTVSLEDAKVLMDRLMDRLDEESVPVGMNAFQEELEALRADIQTCPVWGAMDLHFLDTIVFPYLRTTCEPGYLRQRWTTGDVIARNILVGERGEIRLMDCEFACRTALSAADYQRFGEFSNVPDELRQHVQRRLPGDHRWWRIHFCIDQACKLSRTRCPDAFAPHAPALLHRMWRELQEAPAAPNVSCLLGFLGDLDRLSSRYGELMAHTTTLQSRYEELLAHSNGLQGHYEALAQHTTDLQAAYESLASRLERAEAERDNLARQRERLRHPWLWLRRR